MSSRSHTHTYTHTLPLIHPHPLPFSPIHPPTNTPVTTASPKPCHNRERVTLQSAKTSSAHITQKGKDKKKKRHFSPSQHTALHSQAITGTLERGWLREEEEEGWAHMSVTPPPLNCGHLLILCSALVSWQHRTTMAEGRIGGSDYFQQ